MTITQPLRDEHAELAPHIDALRVAGDAVDQLNPELKRLVDASYEFLADHLIPHAEAEELALYPAVQRVVGSTEATATMARDHVEVRALTNELARYRDELATAAVLDARLANGLRRVLYGLHHLVKLHFAKEEEVYLPILDQGLTPAEAEAMFSSMHSPHHDR
jgi:iron-sulfur cluster repair protein YtfE (RIC family)